MPEILEKQAQAHWDLRAKVPTIVYTFDIPGDPKLGKYVVKVEYKLDRGVVRPAIVSGGKAPVEALADPNAYENIR